MEIQRLSLADKSAWAELLATCFQRRREETQNLLHWLHQFHPPVAWGIWEDEKLVAQYTALLRPLMLNGECVQVGMSVNMAVHPDYRGRGYVKQMAEPVYNEIRDCGGHFGIGFSNAAGVQVDKHSQSYGYQVIGQMSPVLGLVRPQKALPLDLSTAFPFVCDEETLHAPTLSFPKSPAHLCRRYAEHPFRQYHFASADDLGVAVYRPIRMMGMSAVALLDAWSHDIPELLHRFVGTLWQKGVRLIHTLTSPQSYLHDFLAQHCRLVHLPYARTPYYLTLKPLCGDVPRPMRDFRQWNLVGGDVL
jgi:hypothetical protein